MARLFRKEDAIYVRLTIDNGVRTRAFWLRVMRGETLLDAMSRNSRRIGLEIREHETFGKEFVELDKSRKNETYGWHFFIDGGIPYVIEGDKRFYISPYHLKINKSMNIYFKMVSTCTDFDNSVLDPRPDYRTGSFELEKVTLDVATHLLERRSSFGTDIFSYAMLKADFHFWKIANFGVPRARERLPQNGFFLQNAQAGIPAAEASALMPTQQAQFTEFSPLEDFAQPLPEQRFSATEAEQIHIQAKRKKPIPLSSLSRFSAAIFDLDGVIVDSDRLHFISFNRLLAPLGLKISGHEWKHQCTGVGSLAIMKRLFAENRIREDAYEWAKKRGELYQKMMEEKGLCEIKGFQQFRKLLEENGVKIAVASGSHRQNVATSISLMGMKGIPAVALEDVKRGKPAPDLFLLAAKKAGATPSECIVFEDSLAGVEAARRAGMPCIALLTTLPAHELRKKAALVANDFRSKKLRKLVLSLMAKKRLENSRQKKRAAKKKIFKR